MANKDHRLGVDEVNLVKRRLRVIEPNEEAMAQAVEEIDAIYGMDEVVYDAEAHELYVAYDASRICLNCVEEILKAERVAIDQGWWNRFKEEYYKFIDQNVKENAKHEPFSCHKIPPHK